MPAVTSPDGTSIAYERTGSGPVVVLVDGAMCYRGAGPALPLAARLQDSFTVYTYDRRGRGETGDGAGATTCDQTVSERKRTPTKLPCAQRKPQRRIGLPDTCRSNSCGNSCWVDRSSRAPPSPMRCHGHL